MTPAIGHPTICTVVQKKRTFEPPKPEEFKALVAWISMVCDLDEEKFRDEAKKFATEIEREAISAHRSAELLEGLSMVKYTGNVRPSHLARGAIMARLRPWGSTNKRLLRVAEGRLDQLQEVGRGGQLRQQAATLLDAVELIRTNLQWHKEQLKKLRPKPTGRIPSVAKNEVLKKMIEWEVGPTEMSQRLHEGGVRGKSFKPRSLTTDLSRSRRPRARRKK